MLYGWAAGDQPCCSISGAGTNGPGGLTCIQGHGQGGGQFEESGQEHSVLLVSSGPRHPIKERRETILIAAAQKKQRVQSLFPIHLNE